MRIGDNKPVEVVKQDLQIGFGAHLPEKIVSQLVQYLRTGGGGGGGGHTSLGVPGSQVLPGTRGSTVRLPGRHSCLVMRLRSWTVLKDFLTRNTPQEHFYGRLRSLTQIP